MPEPGLTDEEMHRLMLSLLTQRPDEAAPEAQGPFDAARESWTVQQLNPRSDEPAVQLYRVPDFPDHTGTREESADYWAEYWKQYDEAAQAAWQEQKAREAEEREWQRYEREHQGPADAGMPPPPLPPGPRR